MLNLKITQFLLIVYCLFFIQKASCQTSTAPESQYHFIYKLVPQEDYTYQTGANDSKAAIGVLRDLFQSNYSWFENSENTFYVKTTDTLKSIQEYTDIIVSKGAVLARPIELYEINQIDPFPSNVYNYKYTIQIQGDFATKWNSKPYLDSACSLFQTNAAWYNAVDNAFYIKTINQTHSVQEYTQIIENYGGILIQAISIEKLNTNNPSASEINKKQ
jgi:hypothetical protein